MRDEDYRRLALILAAHVDNLQRLASTWGLELAGFFADTDLKVLALIDECRRRLDGGGIGNARFLRLLRRLKRDVAALRGKAASRAIEQMNGELEKLIANEDKWNKAWLLMMIALSAGKEEAGKTKLRPLPAGMMEQIRKYGVYNGNVVDDIYRQILSQDLGRLDAAISNGFMRMGKGDGFTAEQMDADVRKAMGKTELQLRINTTGIVNGVSNDTATMFASRNADKVAGVMWITALDDRVCEDCAAYEGQTFVAGKEPSCPAHFNCRCHLVPVTLNIGRELQNAQP